MYKHVHPWRAVMAIDLIYDPARPHPHSCVFVPVLLPLLGSATLAKRAPPIDPIRNPVTQLPAFVWW